MNELMALIELIKAVIILGWRMCWFLPTYSGMTKEISTEKEKNMLALNTTRNPNITLFSFIFINL